ncbi:LysR substrate-binding domain-containing protein [Phreatobacter stygius]|uniref:LysR family transcriptional regulator n=1 Tax=Phreatobacter stygius TaxID=1940610 RepID=A0A4D7AVF2_9HYPH|nr:LysR substrate-binding domain-containing protein [Phreatobacter stygius]QCI63731.1 LysR family transcriptional regulator [Phreatobacter stygius]
MSLSFRQIECFLAVADAASFSRAAIGLGVTQSALSRHIKELEGALVAQLFYRNGRGALLTEQGRLFYERARDIHANMQSARQELGKIGNNQCVIALTPTFSRFISALVVRTLAERVPHVQVRLVEALSSHILEWLASGRVDLALIYDTPAAHGQQIETVVKERLHLIGPGDAFGGVRQIPFAALADYPLIMPGQPHGARRLIDQLAAECGVSLKHVLDVDSLGAIVDLIRSRMGFGLLPVLPLQTELRARELQSVEIIDPTPLRSIIAVTGKHRAPVRGINDIIRAVKTLFAQAQLA